MKGSSVLSRLPLIGIACGLREFRERQEMHLFLPERYVQGIEQAGGLPILLPITQKEELIGELASRIDGLLLTGGPDIPADYWGEEMHEKSDPAPRERVEFERRLLNHILEADKPLLGICLGHQLINVALGGSLIQDIATFLPEANDHRRPPGPVIRRHPLVIKPDSRLREILKAERIEVATSHHQVVKEPGKNCEVTAWSNDDLIEATEIQDKRFALSVQWHPELTLEDQATSDLFEAFVEAANSGAG